MENYIRPSGNYTVDDVFFFLIKKRAVSYVQLISSKCVCVTIFATDKLRFFKNKTEFLRSNTRFYYDSPEAGDGGGNPWSGILGALLRFPDEAEGKAHGEVLGNR